MNSPHSTQAAMRRARQWARINEIGAAIVLVGSVAWATYMAVVVLAGG